MSRPLLRALALATASLTVASAPALADQAPPDQPPPAAASNPIFDPLRAPVIVLKIGIRRYALVPRTNGAVTTISNQQIEQSNSTTLNQVISRGVPGAASAPSGELHIRGSHGQYSYYLDGAPLPSNVSGSFSDLINPKDIETLRVYTGGFPAEYGGQLAAVFAVTAKAGQSGAPGGFVQQQVQTYSTYETTVQYGGTAKPVSYFISGIRSSSNIRLSPLTETPLHDAGMENIGFGKFDYQADRGDRVTLDLGVNAAQFQVPNTPDRQAVGQDDNQKENSTFANVILRHEHGPNLLSVAFYSHASHLRYFGSPQDLAPSPGDTDTSGLSTTSEDQQAQYVGLRTDYTARADARNHVLVGFDVSQVTGRQAFLSSGVPQADPSQDQPTIDDTHPVTGGDRSLYAQDDWTPGRFAINYGVRYDVHQADITTSQVSPRLNLSYNAGARDTLHAYYDRLFQPVPAEDVIRLQGASTLPFQPERDDFFEVGWEHKQGGQTLTIDTYYRNAKNSIDDQTFGATQIDIPINFAKGYTRGVEVALDGALTPTISYYLNYARSWAQGAGPITGGLLGGASPAGYFYDDHDQTHTASVGVAYSAHRVFAGVDGEYGSGFPYGELDDDAGNPLQINYLRVPAHFIVDLNAGLTMGSGELAISVNNIANHAYVIKQASPFSDVEWGQGRIYGVKWTQNF